MENVVFTQLSIPEIRQIFRQELDAYFTVQKQEAIQGSESTNEFLTIQQASELLRLSVPTLYSKVSKRELPYMKRGKRLYFSHSELLDYIKEGKRKTSAEIKAEALNSLSNKKRLNNGK